MNSTQNFVDSEHVPQETQPKDVPLPAPTLTQLVTGLSVQAMISMGMFPDPVGGQTHILLHQARHLIDTIVLLDEKTHGNRTEEESKTIAQVLHELRMLFVAAQNEKNRRDADTSTVE